MEEDIRVRSVVNGIDVKEMLNGVVNKDVE